MPWYCMDLLCIPYFFLCLLKVTPEHLGFCLFLHSEKLVYPGISCNLSELQTLPAFNEAFLTPLSGPSNNLDREVGCVLGQRDTSCLEL